MSELVSIVIPAFNAEKTIAKCLQSLFSQTYETLQFIVVDDGSTDDTDVVCRQLAEKDERVQLIKMENGGVSKARNAGLEVAEGSYIGFVDADDWVEADMVENLVACMHLTSDCILGTVGVCDDPNWTTYLQQLCGEDDHAFLSLSEAVDEITKQKGLRGYLCNKLFLPTSLRLSENITVSEDLEFVIRYLASFSEGVVVVASACCYHYRRVPQHAFSVLQYPFDREYSRLVAYESLLKVVTPFDRNISNRLRALACWHSYKMLVAWYDGNVGNETTFTMKDARAVFLRNFRYGVAESPLGYRLKFYLCRYTPKVLLFLLHLKSHMGVRF